VVVRRYERIKYGVEGVRETMDETRQMRGGPPGLHPAPFPASSSPPPPTPAVYHRSCAHDAYIGWSNSLPMMSVMSDSKDLAAL
jgi:hypothetical protein